ncbi:MAG TPA: hypothetical protein VGQ83_39825 [Polyangia bacterium]|jgi:hypothetical protein
MWSWAWVGLGAGAIVGAGAALVARAAVRRRRGAAADRLQGDGLPAWLRPETRALLAAEGAGPPAPRREPELPGVVPVRRPVEITRRARLRSGRRVLAISGAAVVALGGYFGLRAHASLPASRAVASAPAGWSPASGWGHADYDRLFNPRAIERLEGTIEQVGEITRPGSPVREAHLMLRTDRGTVEVLLGPAWFVAQQEASIGYGTELAVTGSRVTYEGKTALVATEITRSEGAVLRLRDPASGLGRWAGWRDDEPARPAAARAGAPAADAAGTRVRAAPGRLKALKTGPRATPLRPGHRGPRVQAHGHRPVAARPVHGRAHAAAHAAPRR